MTFEFMHSDGTGVWHNPPVLLAMIVSAVIYTCFLQHRVLKYYQGHKDFFKLKKVLISVFSIIILQRILVDLINGLFFTAPGELMGLHLFWGDWDEILITVFSAPIIAFVFSGIFYLYIKYIYKTDQKANKWRAYLLLIFSNISSSVIIVLSGLTLYFDILASASDLIIKS